ncbi:MAG: beta-hydroxyacyl-ACP dehydratase [Phycisphaerales bacterium]|nr:beta-hydroxyacyl-ACP dehydratase [Phycisphaerales bacterium]
MHFCLIDAIIEQSDHRIVAIKQVSAAEEYLQDHFPSFPVLPGVMMVECLVQAARRLLAERAGNTRLVLGGVRALKYGSFVRPGESLRVTITLNKANDDGTFDVKGEGVVIRPVATGESPTAVSGRLMLRPVRAG